MSLAITALVSKSRLSCRRWASCLEVTKYAIRTALATVAKIGTDRRAAPSRRLFQPTLGPVPCLFGHVSYLRLKDEDPTFDRRRLLPARPLQRVVQRRLTSVRCQ